MTVDAIHLVYENTVASEHAIRSFREFNPAAAYVVICDGGADFGKVCAEHRCIYLHSPIHVGYPSIPQGFDRERALEYLRRVFAAVSLCRASHVMIMEDDVCIINHLSVHDEDEMLVTANCLGNFIHPMVLRMFQRLANTDNLDSFYGMGGGSIFKRATFLEAFPAFYSLMETSFDAFHGVYPQLGWTDCLMSLVMMLRGKKHRVNPQLHELGRWGDDFRNREWEGLEERYRAEYSILHHFKKYYDLDAPTPERYATPRR